jgi:hypothetical protein
MNERVSQASDGYFTPDVFSNPLDVAKSWVESMIGVAKDPLEAGFMTIGNDQSGARSYPKGLSEVEARTIKPKVKDWDKISALLVSLGTTCSVRPERSRSCRTISGRVTVSTARMPGSLVFLKKRMGG